MAAKQPTYTYTQDGQTVGPYIKEQIVSMFERGIIRADAVVDAVDGSTSGTGAAYYAAVTAYTKPSEVHIKDVEMSFGAMIIFILKWVFASIPAAIILALLGAVLSPIFFGLVSGLGR